MDKAAELAFVTIASITDRILAAPFGPIRIHIPRGLWSDLFSSRSVLLPSSRTDR